MNYTYLFLHSDDVDELLEELRNSGVKLKPKFKKYKFTEIFASSNGILIGKYENVVFLFAKGDIETSVEYLDILKIEQTQADETFNDFKFGKYKLEEGEILKLKLDTEFNEGIFLDLIPAMHIEMMKISILLSQCNLQSETMSKEETGIIKEVSRLSDVANKSRNISELERILSEVSELHMGFFRKFVQFKDVNEEIFSSIVKFEIISRELDGWFKDKIQEFKDFHRSLIYFESKFEQTLNGIRDLFSLISLQLDTMRNRENMELQMRTSSLQAAAAIIEFVAVFYYTLKIWEYFLPIGKMPGSLAFLLLTGFTVAVVAYTELLAKFVRSKKITKSLVLATVLLGLILLLMYILPAFIFSGALSPSFSH